MEEEVDWHICRKLSKNQVQRTLERTAHALMGQLHHQLDRFTVEAVVTMALFKVANADNIKIFCEAQKECARKNLFDSEKPYRVDPFVGNVPVTKAQMQQVYHEHGISLSQEQVEKQWALLEIVQQACLEQMH